METNRNIKVTKFSFYPTNIVFTSIKYDLNCQKNKSKKTNKQTKNQTRKKTQSNKHINKTDNNDLFEN